MHVMMLSHDRSNSRVKYRERDIDVHDERSELIVCTGLGAAMVADLGDELISDLADRGHAEPTVQGVMAHLDLVKSEGGA